MAGVNTGPEEARELARLFAGAAVRLSIIDVNDPGGRFRPPDSAERGRFLSALAEHGIAFVRRYSGGPDIHAACGMLAGRVHGGEALSGATGPG
jgi:23S rRNA (adenine2503-C2)-methyltransferase